MKIRAVQQQDFIILQFKQVVIILQSCLYVDSDLCPATLHWTLEGMFFILLSAKGVGLNNGPERCSNKRDSTPSPTLQMQNYYNLLFESICCFLSMSIKRASVSFLDHFLYHTIIMMYVHVYSAFALKVEMKTQLFVKLFEY